MAKRRPGMLTGTPSCTPAACRRNYVALKVFNGGESNLGQLEPVLAI